MSFPVSRADIEAAGLRIAPHIRTTPILELPRGALGGDFIPVLKLEFLQHAGSFKPRGAFNTLLSNAVDATGVAAASGGNHGAAVAYAARMLGHKARIFVPDIASPAKIAAIRACGADLVIGGERFDDAQAACDRYVAETGALKIHPFAATATIAGQGTLAQEWDQQAPIDTALIAVGGGGLVAGAASWWREMNTRVIAVEPDGSRALQAALEAGKAVPVEVNSVAADSLGAKTVGDLVFAICKDTIAQTLTVPDSAIIDAQKLLWNSLRMAIEPGGATALAALLSRAYVPSPGERVGILVCGANIELSKLASLF
jgi:threonine dehydratase